MTGRSLLEVTLARWRKLQAELQACADLCRDAIDRGDQDLDPADRQRVVDALLLAVYELENSALGQTLAREGLIEVGDR